VHVAQLHPKLVLIVDVHYLVVDFDRAVDLDTIFDVYDVRLVKEVVGNW